MVPLVPTNVVVTVSAFGEIQFRCHCPCPFCYEQGIGYPVMLRLESVGNGGECGGR